MDMTSLVSVIVPVYKVEEYLEQCVTSILEQSYQNLEIILVDDGSPDRCPQMCDQWAARDPRIKVIHKENGGLSDARNAGLEVASGRYVAFVDSDDTVDADYVSYLVELLETNNADMSICEFGIIDTTGHRISHVDNNGAVFAFDQKMALLELLKGKMFSNSACTKLYKAGLFYDIRFPYGRIYEDVATTYKLFMKSKRIVFGSRLLYYYLRRPGSITQRPFSLERMDVVRYSEEMVHTIVARYPELEPYGNCKLIADYNEALRPIQFCNHADIVEETFSKVKRIRKDLLNAPEVPLKYKIYAAASFGGRYLYMLFLKAVYNRKKLFR